MIGSIIYWIRKCLEDMLYFELEVNINITSSKFAEKVLAKGKTLKVVSLSL